MEKYYFEEKKIQTLDTINICTLGNLIKRKRVDILIHVNSRAILFVLLIK